MPPPPQLNGCVWAIVIGLGLGLGSVPSSQPKVEAAVTLGSGTSSLLQKDVTDPSDSIAIPSGTTWADAATWESYYASAAWTSISSWQRAPFDWLESASNLFNNELGGGKAKWYDSGRPSANQPNYVQLTFPEAFVLTHFTLSSGNDCMVTSDVDGHGTLFGRNPQSWAIMGSNDGTNWTSIYQYSEAEPFTSTTNTTVLFSSFSDVRQNTLLNSSQKEAFSNRMTSLSKSTGTADFQNTTPYSQYRLEVYSTTGGAQAQLGEWELFGNTVVATDQGNFLKTLSPASHLDASATSTLKTDGAGNISAWLDGSGTGISFSQDNAVNQPNLGTMTIGDNIFQAVEFSKDSGAVRGGDFLTASQSTRQQTVFIVADVDSTGHIQGIFGMNAGDVGIRMESRNGMWQWNHPGNSNDFTNGEGGEMLYNGGVTLLAITEPHLITAVAANPKSFTAALGSYFVLGLNSPRPYGGKIAEVLTFEGTLTPYETQLVNTYFHAKYGLEIGEENRFGVTFCPTHNKEFFAVMRSDADDYAMNSYGTGGFGLGAAANAYDLFNRSLPDGTALFVTSNTDTTFGFTESSTIDGETIFAWDKEWLIQNLSSEEAMAENPRMDLAFDFQNALFPGVDEGVELALLYREDSTQPFQKWSDFIALEGTGFLFSLALSDLPTGFYTLGGDQMPYVPEPATWGMLLVGFFGIWVIRRSVREKV